MNVDLKSRKKRMSLLFDDIKLIHTDDLIKVCKITEKSLDNLKDAVMFYIWDCLISSNPNTKIKISENFFDINQNIIKNLPNITPNGLVVPKKENLMSFNKLQKVIFKEFEKNNINEKIDRVQFPINIRLQSGSFISEGRPRASTKKHTDIWAGDPSGAIIVFLHIYGDYKKIGINFFEAKEFPADLVRTLDDYDHGNKKIEEIQELHLKYDDSGWIFVDPFLLHETYKNSDDIRISLDFRFIPKTKVASDTYEDESRKPYFISVKEWRKFGDTKILSTKQELFGEIKNNNYTKSYPVDIFSKNIANNYKENILCSKKFIGENYIKAKFCLSDEEYNSIFPNQKNLLEYEVLHNNDRDVVIESILRKINMKNLRISGDNNNLVVFINKIFC